MEIWKLIIVLSLHFLFVLAGVDATSATFVGRIGSLDIYARSILLLLELYNWKETKDL